MNEHLTAKIVSDQTGLSIHTLHYYERIGLLDRVARSANGHRRYSHADLTRIDFLKRLRATGMPIRLMQYYISLYRGGEETITERRQMLEEHRRDILAQVDTLCETLALIDAKIANYLERERNIE